MDSKTIVICGLLAASATIAAAEPTTTGTEQIGLDAELRPPGEVASRVAPIVSVNRASLRNPNATHELWGGGVRITGLSGVGALPGVNIGAELAVLVRRDERFVELAIGHWVPQETYVVTEAPQRVELGLDVWTVRGGWASTSMPLRGWLLGEVGELAGRQAVSGALARMVGAVEKDRRWVAAGAGFGVAWPMADHARLVGTVEFAIPVDRKRMMMETGRTFEPDAAAARCNLGLEVGWR